MNVPCVYDLTPPCCSLSAPICSCVIRVTRTRHPVPGSRWLVTILTPDQWCCRVPVSPAQPRAPPATSAGFGTYLVDNVDNVDNVDVVDVVDIPPDSTTAKYLHISCDTATFVLAVQNWCWWKYSPISQFALFEVCSKMFRFRYPIITTGARLRPHFSLTSRGNLDKAVLQSSKNTNYCTDWYLSSLFYRIGT